MNRLWPILVLILCAGLASASEAVDELVQAIYADIPPDELSEEGSTAFPEQLAALLDEDFGLTPTQTNELRLRLAEAWLVALRPDVAAAEAQTVLAVAELPADLRNRAGMALVAAWRLHVEGAGEDQADDIPRDPVAALAEWGDFADPVRARAEVVAGLQHVAGGNLLAAYAAYDRALVLLADEEAYVRVPVYSLRIAAMEQAGLASEAIDAWLGERTDDPAVSQVRDHLLTAGQRLVGKPAPPLAGSRLDEDDGRLDLADLRGTPVLLYFFATWCRPCEAVTPVVARVAEARGEELQVVGVSLDTRDTIGAIDAWRARYGVAFPLIGEGLGWDSEQDDAFHVQAIPALILLDEELTVRAIDLHGTDAATTRERIDRALAGLDGPAEDVDDDDDGHEEVIP